MHEVVFDPWAWIQLIAIGVAMLTILYLVSPKTNQSEDSH